MQEWLWRRRLTGANSRTELLSTPQNRVQSPHMSAGAGAMLPPLAAHGASIYWECSSHVSTWHLGDSVGPWAGLGLEYLHWHHLPKYKWGHRSVRDERAPNRTTNRILKNHLSWLLGHILKKGRIGTKSCPKGGCHVKSTVTHGLLALTQQESQRSQPLRG